MTMTEIPQRKGSAWRPRCYLSLQRVGAKRCTGLLQVSMSKENNSFDMAQHFFFSSVFLFSEYSIDSFF